MNRLIFVLLIGALVAPFSYADNVINLDCVWYSMDDPSDVYRASRLQINTEKDNPWALEKYDANVKPDLYDVVIGKYHWLLSRTQKITGDGVHDFPVLYSVTIRTDNQLNHYVSGTWQIDNDVKLQHYESGQCLAKTH